MLADEHQRVELDDGVVERLLDAPLGRRFGAAGRAVVVAAGQAVGVPARWPEAGQHVALRQRGEVAEAGEAQPGEQADQLGVDLADVVQPGDRERGEERRRPAGGDDPGRPDAPPRGRRRRRSGRRRCPRRPPVPAAPPSPTAATSCSASAPSPPK